MAERIRFTAIINAFAENSATYAGSLMRFLEDNDLTPEDGILIVCARWYDSRGTDKKPKKDDKFGPLERFSQIVCLAGPLCMPQTVAEYIRDHCSASELFITAGNKFGDELAVHIGAVLGGSSLTGINAIDSISDTITVRKKIYAGHVTGRFELNRKPFSVSIEQGLPACDLPEHAVTQAICSADVTVQIDETDIRTNLTVKPLETSSDLDEADSVIIAGRGVGSRKNAEEICALAEAAGIPSAGSRPCVMNAWLPMNRLIGVSGKMISPKVAVLLGVSGAPAFYEGIKGSSRIIAVNNDPDAPVSKSADLFVNGDCMETLRAFMSKVENAGNTAEAETEGE